MQQFLVSCLLLLCILSGGAFGGCLALLAMNGADQPLPEWSVAVLVTGLVYLSSMTVLMLFSRGWIRNTYRNG